MELLEGFQAPTLKQWTPKDIHDVARRMDRWRHDGDGPIHFAREALGIEPTDHQKALLRLMAAFKRERGKYGVTVRSGQGCGKSSAAGMTILWFLTVFEDSLVHCTAPTEKQLHTVLWGEMDRQIRGSKFLSQMLDWRATRILVRGMSPSWSAVAHTARNMEAIQGKHRDHMLVVCDEASGIEDQFLVALMGGLTGLHNPALLISNPTSTNGYYYDTHHSKAHLWEVLHFNSRDSPLVPKEHIARMESEYGPDSPILHIRVDGEFPTQSEDALVSIAWTEAAKHREIFEEDENQPLVLGVDPARFGSDFTAMALMQGRNVVYLDRWNGMSITEIAGRVTALYRECPEIATINIDEIGLGGGVVDMLMENQENGIIPPSVEICGVNVSEASEYPGDYPRLRDQMWFEFADMMKDGQIAFDRKGCDEVFIEQLLSDCVPVRYKFTVSGQRVVDTKDEMKKKLGHSPDLTDALLLACREQRGGLIGFVNLQPSSLRV